MKTTTASSLLFILLSLLFYSFLSFRNSPSRTHFSSIPSPRRDIFRRLVSLVAVPDLPYLRELAVNMVDGVRATPAAQLPDPSLPDAVDALAADLEACLSADEVCLRAAISFILFSPAYASCPHSRTSPLSG